MAAAARKRTKPTYIFAFDFIKTLVGTILIQFTFKKSYQISKFNLYLTIHIINSRNSVFVCSYYKNMLYIIGFEFQSYEKLKSQSNFLYILSASKTPFSLKKVVLM